MLCASKVFYTGREGPKMVERLELAFRVYAHLVVVQKTRLCRARMIRGHAHFVCLNALGHMYRVYGSLSTLCLYLLLITLATHGHSSKYSCVFTW